MSDVKAQLAALAARKSGGKTTDPAAFQSVSSINAKVPALPAKEETKTPAGKEKARAKGKMSSRQKQRAEKAKERAVDLGGKLETKLMAKEGRKARRDRAKKAWE